jgi:integrase
VSETANLLWGDINFERCALTVRLGKGNKTRSMGLSNRMVEILRAYREDASDDDTVFRDEEGEPLTRMALYNRLKCVGVRAKVKVSPHALRRAFVTINANKGRPLHMLQMACGHSDIKTTRDYCLTSESEVIEAMKGWD